MTAALTGPLQRSQRPGMLSAASLRRHLLLALLLVLLLLLLLLVVAPTLTLALAR